VEAADFYDTDGECLEPDEQPMQSCLVFERAVYHRLDRLDRSGEPVEVKQHLGRENTGYADLVNGQRHRAPLQVGIYGQVPRLRFTVLYGPTRGG
jgi:hypothetical protein